MADLVLVLIIAIAGLIQGTAGFGLGLFAMGVLAMVIPLEEAITFVSMAILCSTMLNLWRVRKSVVWREGLPILAAAIPTTVIGVYLLKNADPDLLRTGLAVIIVAGCLVTLWSPGTARIHKPFPWAYFAGGVGGLFGGALSTGGPPVVLYALLRGWEKAETKGTMSVYFLGTAVFRTALLIATGVATGPRIAKGLALLVPAMAGAYLGTRVFRRMSTRLFRFAATGLLALLAIRIVLT